MAEALLKQPSPPIMAQHTFTVSCRMIFYINVPIGMIGVGMAMTLMVADLLSGAV